MSCMKLFSYLPVWTQTLCSMCCVLTVPRPAVLQFVQSKGKLQIQQAIKKANLQLYKWRVNQFKQFIFQSQHNKQQKQARAFSFTTDNKLYFFSVAILDRIVTAVRNSYFPLQWKGKLKTSVACTLKGENGQNENSVKLKQMLIIPAPVRTTMKKPTFLDLIFLSGTYKSISDIPG